MRILSAGLEPFVLILQFTFHPRSKWEAPDDIAPIFSDSVIKKTADVRIATDSWIAVFYYFLIKLYCLSTSGLAVFIVKWKFLKTASRFETSERSNEMRITAGGKKVKNRADQLWCNGKQIKDIFPWFTVFFSHHTAITKLKECHSWLNSLLQIC